MNAHKAHNSLTSSALINSQEPTPHFNVAALKANFFPPFFFVACHFFSPVLSTSWPFAPNLGSLPSSLAFHLRLQDLQWCQVFAYLTSVMSNSAPSGCQKPLLKASRANTFSDKLNKHARRKPRRHEDIAHLMRPNSGSSTPFHVPISPTFITPTFIIPIARSPSARCVSPSFLMPSKN